VETIHNLSYNREEGIDIGKDLVMIALSTCGFCKRAIRFLRDNNIAFRYVYFDYLDSETKEKIKKELSNNFDEKLAFPFLIIDDRESMVGFNEEKYRDKLGLKTGVASVRVTEPEFNEEELQPEYQFVNNVANHKTWKLVQDEDFLRTLVEGLHKNRQRYGYYLCPCRITSGGRQEDKDIVCPCDYAPPDIEEYGHCYCGLYLSSEFAASGKNPSSIPERRHKENQ
jgi:ferredoxin-thioredoxin reductase catalytic subunit/glutaredoxin